MKPEAILTQFIDGQYVVTIWSGEKRVSKPAVEVKHEH